MKTLKTVIKIIGGILLFFIIILSILGYYLTRNDFSNPPEHYVSIGKRVYTTAPAMMIDESYDSLNLSGRGIKIGVLDTGFGGLRQRSWTKNIYVAAYANFIDGDTTDFFIKETRPRARPWGLLLCMHRWLPLIR